MFRTALKHSASHYPISLPLPLSLPPYLKMLIGVPEFVIYLNPITGNYEIQFNIDSVSNCGISSYREWHIEKN
jgi:hypothetical protein